jgi:hypothetical protein
MTRKLINTLFVIACLASAPSLAEDGDIRGAGTASCGQWTAYRKPGDLLAAAFESWLMGYLSAFATFQEGGREILGGTDNMAFVGWVSNFCKAHPLDSINSAALALVTEMTRKATAAVHQHPQP